MENQEVTRDTLKIQGLKQRMGELVSEYEEKYAELRVDYTILMNAYQGLQEENKKLKHEASLAAEFEEHDADPDTVGDSSSE